MLATLLCLLAACGTCYAQSTTVVDTSRSDSAIIIAGKQYRHGGLYNWFWGRHYRTEWTTPVKVKAVQLDTLFGGLTPVRRGGGRQTRTLRLQNSKGKEYVLRSIDKTYSRALPEVFRNTFVESVANDQVSTAHPYAAITVPILAKAAGVYHTNPQIVYVPKQPALDSFSHEFGNQLYLLEERPDGFQGDADNFGNAEDVDGTEKMLRKVFEENDHRVDQVAFVRARLFDMFLSDWGRHEDQWRWATFKEEGVKVYRPIPRDRDQAFTRFDGLLVGVGTAAAKLVYLQSVDYTIKDVAGYNFQARHLDRQLANEPPLETWVAIANDLQRLLTNDIIDSAIGRLPREVYSISGPELAAKLKKRRDHLDEFAKEYYAVLSKEVDVVGSDNREVFTITGLNNNSLLVEITDLDSAGQPRQHPFYSRIFHAGQTEEIRLYGRNGRDQFVFSGQFDGDIKIRVIGGPKRDHYIVPAQFKASIKVYDDKDNAFDVSERTKLRLSNDSAVHSYDYNAFKPDFSGFKAGISYNNEDRLFARFGYRLQRQKWRKQPFGYQSDFLANYSITQRAPSFEYLGIVNKVFGQWNMSVLAQYDAIRDVHFPGIGNNTLWDNPMPDFYRYTNREVNAEVGLFRNFTDRKILTFSAFFQAVRVRQHADRFISKVFANGNQNLYQGNQFVGARLDYEVTTVNDLLFPSKGVTFVANSELAYNLKMKNTPVARVEGQFTVYVPVARSLTLAVKTGAATLTGDATFYQLNKLGSGRTMRGFPRFRFYGTSMVYNQNELQYNFKVRTYFFNGTMGVLALLDNGRVWQPGETSNKWHTGMGGGLMIAPFNKFTLTGTLTKSVEALRLNVRIGRLL